MRLQLPREASVTQVSVTLDDGRQVTISSDGTVTVRPGDPEVFGYSLALPRVEDVAGTCSRLYSDDEQMYGGHGELPGYLTVTHLH